MENMKNTQNKENFQMIPGMESFDPQKKQKPKIDELAVIALENYKCHKLLRDYAAKIIELKAIQLATDLKLQGEEREKALSKHDAEVMNQWSLILSRSTSAINELKGIKYYTDINAAADRLQREGYEILDPSQGSEQLNLF
jgi:hypothetical protein